MLLLDRMRGVDREFEARPDLDSALLPRLRALPYFREAPRAEIDGSFAAYEVGDPAELCRTWARIAEPTRASMPAAMAWAYAHAGKGPRLVNATVFLDSLRATLAAGERFRSRLSPAVHAVIHAEFPYLERRHEHVPAGDTPSFEFPQLFRDYIEWGDLDDTRARWQLAVCLNEVQQATYSDFAARLFRLPELHRHAEARARAGVQLPRACSATLHTRSLARNDPRARRPQRRHFRIRVHQAASARAGPSSRRERTGAVAGVRRQSRRSAAIAGSDQATSTGVTLAGAHSDTHDVFTRGTPAPTG